MWAIVQKFLAKLLGVKTIPPEVNGADENIARWHEVYRCKAPWLAYDFVTADGVKRTRQRMSLNAAKIVCAEIAGLVLAEPPEVKGSDLVMSVIKDEDLWRNLRTNTEYQAALGGQVLKICLEPGEIGLDFVKAPNFVPLMWDNTEVKEAAFLDRRVVGGKALIRVETHRKVEPSEGVYGYTITNRVFNVETGIEVPLSQFDEDIEAEYTVNTESPLFVYIPNPEANNIELESPLGISVFANSMDTLQTLDIAFDGMKTELVMGRQRILVPRVMARTYVDKDGKTKRGFDPTDEAYVLLEGDDSEKGKITDVSGQLRMEQFRNGIQTALDLLSVQVGFSSGYLTFDGSGGLKTATEVISDNSKTFKTIQAFRENLDKALKSIFGTINELGLYYKIEGASDADTEIIWDDSVIEGRDQRATYWTGLYQAKLADPVSALMGIHGISEEEATAMYDKIKKDSATVGATDLFGNGA